MALEEELSSARQEMLPIIDCLRDCADLAGVDEHTFQALAAVAIRFSVPAGNLLFESGAPSEGVYLLVNGRLGMRMDGSAGWQADIEHGELVGESGWLLNEPRGASVVALRDSEMLLIPNAGMAAATQASTALSLALARLSARRLLHGSRQERSPKRARVFVVVPNNDEVNVAEFAADLVAALTRSGTAELVWDVRASLQTLAWFNRIEEMNDYVVYVADPTESGWTRQCCRQADVILLAAGARAAVRPWPASVTGAAVARGARIELALLHDGTFAPGAATRWLDASPTSSHHHVIDATDLSRMTRLMTRRGVGLVLSGGGARGFAHLGVIRALREARVPIDLVGGSSIGAIFAAGVAMGWSDAEMRSRYRRGFVDSNPVNDYTFPWIALTRGRKVTRLLHQEYGDVLIEDLRQPFFCISSNLSDGRVFEHRRGPVAHALRASVAIPGVMPPVVWGSNVLIDGAAINNLPVDVMQRHAPGLVIGSDVGAEKSPRGTQRLNIFQILMHAGMVNSSASAAALRSRADVLLKPPLDSVDLLDWRAFDQAIDVGYAHATQVIAEIPDIPRIAAVTAASHPTSSLELELERRMATLGI